MALDALERKVLLVMAVVCAFIVAASVAGYALGISLGGTDAAVEGDAAGRAGADPTPAIALPPWGEPVLFFVISSVLGLAAGYLLPSVLERREAHA